MVNCYNCIILYMGSNAVRLCILRIDIKKVTFLHLMLDHQFKILISRKISTHPKDVKEVIMTCELKNTKDKYFH